MALSAFKVIGYPYYYDDFICEYRRILHSTNTLPPTVKHEVQRIVQDMRGIEKNKFDVAKKMLSENFGLTQCDLIELVQRMTELSRDKIEDLC